MVIGTHCFEQFWYGQWDPRLNKHSKCTCQGSQVVIITNLMSLDSILEVIWQRSLWLLGSLLHSGSLMMVNLWLWDPSWLLSHLFSLTNAYLSLCLAMVHPFLPTSSYGSIIQIQIITNALIWLILHLLNQMHVYLKWWQILLNSAWLYVRHYHSQSEYMDPNLNGNYALELQFLFFYIAVGC